MALTELQNVKAPGWARVVAELTASAPDDRLYLARLLSTLGQVSGARQAVLWVISGQGENAPMEPRAALIWPFGPDVVDASGKMSVTPDALFDPARAAESQVELAAEVKASARAAAASRQVCVYGLESDSLMYDGQGSKGHVQAVPVPQGMPHESPNLPLSGVVTLLTDSRSRQALQTTTALVEVIAGYVYQHWTQQALRRSRASSASLDLAARLIASVNGTADFKGCGLQLVNDLTRQLSVDRVALGWVEGANPLRTNTEGARNVRCVALSDTENVDRRMAMVQKLESAMDECLDQGQPVLYPAPAAAGDAVLAQAIVHAHRELASTDAKLKVASFPLRVADKQGDKTVGVLTIESAGDGKIDVATIELIQATLDLLSPVLAVRHSDDRVIPLRVWDWAVRTAAWAVGPKHTVWKAAGVLLLAVSVTSFAWTTTYRVGAPMTLKAKERRVIAMPFDGTIAKIGEGAEAGRPVKAGQLLVQLDTRDMLLSAMEADNQYVQFDKQADESLRKGELSEAAQARARAEQSRARRDLLRSQIDRSRIVSPLDGTITAGDLKDKVGAAVKLGDKLFEVADLTTLRVIARVGDGDIALVREGATGEISPKSAPAMEVPFTVEQVVPLARAEEGQNIFEVRGVLTGEVPASVLDGMEGQARFNTERRSLAWIASRRIIDQLRVWLWW